MKKLFIVISILGSNILANVCFAQFKANDISVEKLPTDVKNILGKYIKILKSPSIDACASAFIEVAGGGLVNENFPVSLRSDVKIYSLKKDFDNIKFYANPVVITRVNVSQSNGNGFGKTAIAGTVYKIWIKKKEGVSGMPAPIQIMVPKGNAQITTPKVVNIGSF